MIDVPGAVAIEALDAGVAPTRASPRTTATRCASSDCWRPPSALVDRSNRDVIAVPGEERATWLHTLTTQHLADLRAGPGQRAAGAVAARARRAARLVAEDGTTTWLDTEPGAGAGLLKYLEMMRFFTKVEPRDATAEMAVLSLVGPRAVAAAAKLDESLGTLADAGRGRGAGRQVRRR